MGSGVPSTRRRASSAVGRIRTIKPELFLDEDLGALPGDYLALFVGLWTVADREGRLEWRPARLKATLFPYREIDLEALAEGLERIGKVRRYEVDGKRLLWVCGFVRHQRPHPKEPASVLPPPPEPCKETAGREKVAMLPVESRGKGREGNDAADFALEEQRAVGRERTPSRQERLAELFWAMRGDALGDVVPDDRLDVATINRILEPALAAGDDVLEASARLYLEDEFAKTRDPPCPIRLWAKQWNKWVSRAAR